MKMAANLWNLPRYKRALGVMGAGITICSLVVVAWFAFQSLHSGFSLEDTRWTLIAASISIYLIGLFCLPLMWYRLLTLFWESPTNEASSNNMLSLYTSYSRSWLARYMPGRIWMFGGRLVLAARKGIPSEAVIRSMAFENMLGLGTMAIIGIFLYLSANSRLFHGLLVLLLGLAALGGGIPLIQEIFTIKKLTGKKLTGPGVSIWRRAAHFTHRVLLGNKPLPVRGSYCGVMLYGLHSFSQLVFIVILAESFVHLSVGQALTIAGAWGFSATLGFFVFIAPGPAGLGVRDGIALLFFSQVIDLPTAGLIIGVSRMVMIISDIIFVGIIEVVVALKRITQRVSYSSAGA